MLPEIGVLLRQLRQGRGLSLAAVRDLVRERTGGRQRLDRSQLSKIERGLTPPTMRVLALLEGIYEQPAGSLQTLAGWTNADGRLREFVPSVPHGDVLANIRAAIYRGPWSDTTAALMYAVLAELADNRAQFWRDKFEEAIKEVRAERFYGRGEPGGPPFTPDEVEEATISRIRSSIFPT